MFIFFQQKISASTQTTLRQIVYKQMDLEKS